MLFGYIIRQHIVGMAAHRPHDRDAVVRSFVTIFLEGLNGPARSRTSRTRAKPVSQRRV